MKVKFESQFAKDLKSIKNEKLLLKIKKVINQCKLATNLNEISNLKKLTSYKTFYRLRIGDYRIGIEIIDDEIIFVRCLHRKNIYRDFP